ncbi:MAG: hypothetical protein F6K09_13055, partial [Merismopedia sp. SIO2A8]|nr:hypothetical protein [Merismopedia sp. SIO2A8]
VQSHGNTCKRDMGYILRHIAISILKDDTESFVELILWMENVTKALKKEESAVRAYQSLRSIVRSTLPEEMVTLIDPYLDILIKALLVGS